MIPVSHAKDQAGLQAPRASCPTMEEWFAELRRQGEVKEVAFARMVARGLEASCACGSTKIPLSERDIKGVASYPYTVREYSICGCGMKGLVAMHRPTMSAVSIEINGTWDFLGNDKIIVNEGRDQEAALRIFHLETGRELAAPEERVCTHSACDINNISNAVMKLVAAYFGFADVNAEHRTAIGFTKRTAASFPDGRFVYVDRCRQSDEETLRVWDPRAEGGGTANLEMLPGERVECATRYEERVLISAVNNGVRSIILWEPRIARYFQFEASELSAPIIWMTCCGPQTVAVSEQGEIGIWARHISDVDCSLYSESIPVDYSALGEDPRSVLGERPWIFRYSMSVEERWVLMDVDESCGYSGVAVCLDTCGGKVTLFRHPSLPGGVLSDDLLPW